jgi:hypothetical protein
MIVYSNANSATGSVRLYAQWTDMPCIIILYIEEGEHEYLAFA